MIGRGDGVPRGRMLRQKAILGNGLLALNPPGDRHGVMNILQLPMDEVHPYGNNPRKNDNAVEAVAASIKQYLGKALAHGDIGRGDGVPRGRMLRQKAPCCRSGGEMR